MDFRMGLLNYFCSFASAGTCNLFNNNFEFQILKQFSDPEGRFVIADVKTEGKILTFFKNALNQLVSLFCGEIVLGGYYNLALEVEKDKIGGNLTTHKNLLKEVLYIANLLDLVDIWLIFNPDAKRFTWRRRKADIHCRLDFSLTSSS